MTKFHHAFKFEYNGITNELWTDVLIGAASLDQPFDEKKKLIPLKRAIWDTGATSTVIPKALALALELKPTSFARVQGVNSLEDKKPVYFVDLLLPNRVILQNAKVIESDGRFDILIGMDIIQRGDFAISNAGGKTRFSFCLPSHDTPICLLEKSNKVNERYNKKRR